MGGGSYITYYYSLYNYATQSTMGCPSAYDCVDCFAHNRLIDPNWTRTSKHSFTFPPKSFCSEHFPYDIVQRENSTNKQKKLNAAMMKSEIVKECSIEKRTMKNCHHLAFMTGEIRKEYLDLDADDFRVSFGYEGNGLAEIKNIL